MIIHSMALAERVAWNTQVQDSFVCQSQEANSLLHMAHLIEPGQVSKQSQPCKRVLPVAEKSQQGPG